MNNIYSGIIKTLNFKYITKKYLQDRINTFIINEEISNKKSGIWTLTLPLMTQKR